MLTQKRASSEVKTHPWISFRLDLARLLPRHWVLLGECSAKIEHVVGTPLDPSLARELNTAYVSKGVHGTAAIEGNTLTEEQVALRLQGELDLPPSQEYLGREIDNLSRAYQRITAGIADEDRDRVSEAEIRELNRLVLDDLPADEDVVPGEYALCQHGVGRYRAPAPADIRRLMPALEEWLADEVWESEFGAPFAIPLLRAIVATSALRGSIRSVMETDERPDSLKRISWHDVACRKFPVTSCRFTTTRRAGNTIGSSRGQARHRRATHWRSSTTRYRAW